MTSPAPATAGAHQDRFRALDGLRGLAALHVVLYHALFPNHLTNNGFARHGYLAVDLFFMLSGFVIAANYSRRITDASSFKRFIGLRFFRLYPLHIAILIALVGLELAKVIAIRSGAIAPGSLLPFTGGNSFETLIANIFFLQGLPVVDTISWNTPSWSISAEFATYLVFGLLVLTGVTRKRSFFVLGAILAVIAYGALAVVRGSLDATYDLGIVRCLAGFFLGMLLFELRAGSWGKRLSAQSTALITAYETAVVAALVLTLSLASGLAIFLIVPIFAAAVGVFQLDRGYIAAILMTNPIQFLGRVSYSIYMVHAPIWFVLAIILRRVFAIPVSVNPATQVEAFQVNPWVGDALVIGLIAAVVATSALTYAFIEAPARDYGRRILTKSQRGGVSPALRPTSTPPS